jgi:hypothetical protein
MEDANFKPSKTSKIELGFEFPRVGARNDS